VEPELRQSLRQEILDAFGPVSFRDNDIKTSLDFLRQMLQVQVEEMSIPLTTRQESDGSGDAENPEPEASEQKAKDALSMLEGGSEDQAAEFIRNDEVALALVLQICNTAGIEYRKAGLFDRAITEFKKALFFHPQDEGLYYNLARAFMEKKDWEQAEQTIREGLKTKPDFREGKALLKYIRFQMFL
jgi:tetratricopeptide (TPR) repeat protein